MAEMRYRLPPGLLLAIGRVETGRADPATGQLEPWPWAVQAEGQGRMFNSKTDAIHWVAEALARGVRSIDTGCMQVNLFFHPDAFASLEQAFDPRANADYAARFLLRLYAPTGRWDAASGFYHSREPLLAAAYQQRVMHFRSGSAEAVSNSMQAMLRVAWLATVNKAEAEPSKAAGSHSTLARAARAPR